jgi:ankyrin repeat protein
MYSRRLGNSLEETFLKACKTGDIERVKDLFSKYDFDINGPDDVNKGIYLYTSVANENNDVTDFLIENGASIIDSIQYSIEHNDTFTFLNLFNLYQLNEETNTDINSFIIGLAVEYKQWRIVKRLVQMGNMFTYNQNIDGDILMGSVKDNIPDLFEYILNKGTAPFDDISDATVHAAEYGRLNMMMQLLEIENILTPEFLSVLFNEALTNGHAQIVEYLLSIGANMNQIETINRYYSPDVLSILFVNGFNFTPFNLHPDVEGYCCYFNTFFNRVLTQNLSYKGKIDLMGYMLILINDHLNHIVSQSDNECNKFIKSKFISLFNEIYIPDYIIKRWMQLYEDSQQTIIYKLMAGRLQQNKYLESKYNIILPFNYTQYKQQARTRKNHSGLKDITLSNIYNTYSYTNYT